MNTPRRRTSGLLKELSIEPSTEIVNDNDDKPDGQDQPSASQEKGPVYEFPFFVWIHAGKLLWITAGLIFCFAWVTFLKQHGFSFSYITHDGPDGALHHEASFGIPLHPDEHVYREPATLEYNWSVTRNFRAPDGVKKRVYLINGVFPGPTIEARSGDTLKIHLSNNIEDDEGLSIHWHGLNMKGTNHMDGAVGLTQCPIPKGKMFTYEFEIDKAQHGSYWYHAHSQVQRADGLYGGLVVHKPAEEGLPLDLERYNYGSEILLLIGDWYHRSAEEILAYYMSSRSFGNEPVPDSLLINGVGSFNCSMAARARPLECVQKPPPRLRINSRDPFRLRIVNTGSFPGVSLGIEQAKMLPIQVDGGNEIEREATNQVGVIYPGERADVIVFWNEDVFNQVNLHISFDEEDFNYPNPSLVSQQDFPLDISPIRHPHSIRPRIRELNSDSTYFDLQRAQSLYTLPLPSSSPSNMVLYTTTMKLAQNRNIPKGFMNHTSWSPQSSPALPLSLLPRSSWDTNQFIPYIPSPDSNFSSTMETEALWIDIVLNNLEDGGHPFHLHGHSFYILSTHKAERGWGSYNPFALPPEESPAGAYNLDRPLLKDTVYVPRRGYVVLRVKMDNPGFWMFHCHILWHQASGMAMGFQVGGDEEKGFMNEIGMQKARELCAESNS
jgi:FtsP/CotA-like multicopper oxidase with cupredoxin domain